MSSLIIYSFFWMSDVYYALLISTCIFTIMVGGILANFYLKNTFAILFLFIGIIIGQWWIVEEAIVITLWSLRNMAP
jgi:hypothetical protein